MIFIENYSIDWKYLKKEDLPLQEISDFSIDELKYMFYQIENPKLQELAYLSFISHSAWGINFDFTRGVRRTNMQLRLPLCNNEGLSWHFQTLNPLRIWASEDTLDFDKNEMVKAAIEYSVFTKKPILPVIVWYIPYEPLYKYVCHDGHHRIFIHSQLKIPIPAVVLEYWIDNREDPILPQKIHYQQIDCLVKDLPIENQEFSRN